MFFSFEAAKEINKLVVFSVDLKELAFAKRILIMSEYESDLSFLDLRRLTMRGKMEMDDLGSTPALIFTRITHLDSPISPSKRHDLRTGALCITSPGYSTKSRLSLARIQG